MQRMQDTSDANTVATVTPDAPHLILEAERTSTDTSLTSLSDDFKDRLSLIWRRTHA